MNKLRSSNHIRLMETVVSKSYSKKWDEAVLEWEIINCEEDSSLSSYCICGKDSLYYLFTIRNARNGNILYPIGSSCIKKFGREDLKRTPRTLVTSVMS